VHERDWSEVNALLARHFNTGDIPMKTGFAHIREGFETEPCQGWAAVVAEHPKQGIVGFVCATANGNILRAMMPELGEVPEKSLYLALQCVATDYRNMGVAALMERTLVRAVCEERAIGHVFLKVLAEKLERRTQLESFGWKGAGEDERYAYYHLTYGEYLNALKKAGVE
jgi:hypothetical protein